MEQENHPQNPQGSPGEPTLFESEKQVLSDASALIAEERYQSEGLFPHFDKLYREYKKLYRHFARMVKINDRQQSELKATQDELLAEIEKRKKTEQRLRENEVQLVKARETAEKALEDKARFFASMSHEIRTPLNGIIGSANLLQTTQLTTSQNEFIDTIISSGKILLVVINDILDFSKLESGNLELESLPLDLESTVDEVFDVISGPAVSKNLELLQFFTSPLPLILGDNTRLSQVLVNLLNNAIKFTDRGEISIRISETSRSQSEIELLFEVQDTGIGIPPDRVDKLFKAFSQVDASTTRKYGGTGLGLSICQKLVELMKGHIWVESQAGVGSTFKFSLTAPLAQEQVERSPLVYSELAGKHLLLVDDNASNLARLQQLAQEQGMKVFPASTYRDALALIAEQDQFDLALLDLKMPDMDGLELYQNIHDILGDESFPTILMTPKGRRAQPEQGKPFPQAQVAKPTKNSLLLLTMKELITGEYKPDQLEEKGLDYDPNLALKHPLTILLAEDNKVNQKIAEATFRLLGFQVDLAENGLEVLGLLDQRAYDMIFMDVQMPEMDGLEATRSIRQNRERSQGPIIVAMTANASMEDREECLRAGMDDHIPKPVLIDHIAQSIMTWGAKITPVDPENANRQAPMRSSSEPPRLVGVPDSYQDPDGLFDHDFILDLKTNYQPELVTEITAYYREELELARAALAALIQASDWAELERRAHKLKGSSMNIGIKRLADIFKDLEEQSPEGDRSKLEAYYQEFCRYLDPTLEGLRIIYPEP